MKAQELASIIDYSLLGPNITKNQVTKLCAEARRYKFGSVSVNPYYTEFANEELQSSSVGVNIPIGFPHGANDPKVKKFEAQKAMEAGADSIDMVINIAALKDKDYQMVKGEMESIKKVIAKDFKDVYLRIILENPLLNKEQKVAACELAKEAGADCVKTATGFGPGKNGATIDDIKLMRSVVGEKMGVKAAGGVRNYEIAMKMIKAGADQIGASRAIEIIEGADK